MKYTPIVREQDLPTPGPLHATAQEREHLDFKSFASKTKGIEHAKDIAAFANSLGGTILVGVTETTGTLAIPGVAGQTATEVKDIYEHAALKCSPKARIDAVIIRTSTGVDVVAINVPPSPDAVLGVPGVASEAEAPNSWRYPIRRATQTDFLTPEQLSLHMNPTIRRVFVRLSAIPTTAPVRVDSVHYSNGQYFGTKIFAGAAVELFIKSVSLETNALELERQQPSSKTCRVPLMDVVDVWEHMPDSWAIRLCGQLDAPAQIATLTYRLGFDLRIPLIWDGSVARNLSGKRGRPVRLPTPTP
jgi:hypothetical protein